MGSESDLELISPLKLPVFSIKMTPDSPERSGTSTPPLHKSASVPFRWEEEPGKPKPCSALITYTDPRKCLELPPRLLSMESNGSNSKLCSPTTVLDGPYVFRSKGSSFRIGSECYGSFRRSLSPEREEEEEQQLGALVLKRGRRERSVFGSLRRGVWKSNKREVSGGSYVFPSSGSECSRDGEESGGDNKIKRTGSFSTLSVPLHKSHFWATICGGLKQVVPWKNKKAKKDALLS